MDLEEVGIGLSSRIQIYFFLEDFTIEDLDFCEIHGGV